MFSLPLPPFNNNNHELFFAKNGQDYDSLNYIMHCNLFTPKAINILLLFYNYVKRVNWFCWKLLNNENNLHQF